MNVKISKLVCNAAIRAQIQKYECLVDIEADGVSLRFAPPRECFSISVELRLHEGSILTRGVNNT